MVVTGWYDAEDLYGSFKTYQAVEKLNPNVNNVLVVGPWHHGGWASVDGDKLGPISFGSKTAAFYRAEIELPFFERHLKDHKLAPLAEATVFETGSNTWRTFSAWPPRDAQPKQLFFQAAGGLDYAAPKDGEAFDEYVSDPAAPVLQAGLRRVQARRVDTLHGMALWRLPDAAPAAPDGAPR